MVFINIYLVHVHLILLKQVEIGVYLILIALDIYITTYMYRYMYFVSCHNDCSILKRAEPVFLGNLEPVSIYPVHDLSIPTQNALGLNTIKHFLSDH